MKRLFIIGGSSSLAFLVLGLILVRAMGFEPRERSPGLWLSGEVVTTAVTDWSFTDQIEHVYVETRTWYSIPPLGHDLLHHLQRRTLPDLHLPSRG